MDKMMGEEDLKGLEEEIENAVDRLFVDKKGGITESFLKDPSAKLSGLEPLKKTPSLEPFSEVEERSEKENPIPPPSAPLPFSKSIEKMEAQILSLEWEISEEKLIKTREEVIALRELLKQEADVTSILNAMDKALSQMIKDEENILPPWIKFLLDAKDTIKLLMRKETEGEIGIYKQLAYLGMEARFSCLEGMKRGGEGRDRTEIPFMEKTKIEETLSKMNLFLEKMKEIFKKIEPYFSKIEQMALHLSEIQVETKPLSVSITIFKVNDRLFGVESEKVFKLFKVPNTFQERYSNQQKIRLRGCEVKLIDLKKLLSIREGEPKEEIKILMVKDNGGYKGFMVDQVLKKLSTTSDQEGKAGEYFSGIIHSTFQERPVEIPIIDLKKI